MADDVPSEPRTNRTVVSYFRLLLIRRGLLRTLPELKCSALVSLEAEGYCK